MDLLLGPRTPQRLSAARARALICADCSGPQTSSPISALGLDIDSTQSMVIRP